MIRKSDESGNISGAVSTNEPKLVVAVQDLFLLFGSDALL